LAARLNLHIEKRDDPVEVSMKLPKQAGLSHDVWLCLQNGDELWFVVGDFFTCSMFPFPEMKDRFENYLRCTLIGEYRIVLKRRRETSPPVCSELQRPCPGGWETICHYGRDLGFSRLFGLRLTAEVLFLTELR
jgi:hypothetical protein